MKVLPIIFSAPMIRALLAGKKTQTRRVVKGLSKRFPLVNLANVDPRRYSGQFNDPASWGWAYAEDGDHMSLAHWPEATGYAPGDWLWVREGWQFRKQRFCYCAQGSEPSPCDDWSEGIGCRSARDGIVFRADGVMAPRWRSPAQMPRWASRLTLRVTDVRVQRLQDISPADIEAEGVDIPSYHRGDLHDPHRWRRDHFMPLWDAINGKKPGRAWEDDPWVVALTFDVHRMNVDAFLSRKDEAQ